MANQEGFNEKNNKSGSAQIKNDFKKGMPNQPQEKSGMSGQDFQNQENGQLEQLVSFMKENWKNVLAELVTAGVTAYLTHTTKEKAAKN